MKNVSTIKSAKNESPKTPGGISKSLLTPCRRVGLSRNWKKAGPSPFVSPLAGSTPSKVDLKDEKKQSRKRKDRVESEENGDESQCTPETPSSNDGILDVDESATSVRTAERNKELSSTPTRHIEVPRKKKSKILLNTLNKDVQEKEPLCDKQAVENTKNSKEEDNVEEEKQQEIDDPVTSIQNSRNKGKKAILTKTATKIIKENVKTESYKPLEAIEHSHAIIEVVTPVQRSKSKGKKILSPKSSLVTIKEHLFDSSEDKKVKENLVSPNMQDKSIKETEIEPKHRSPNELTKECIVVIQKKIFKTDKNKQYKAKSQTVFESDSDDVPLGQLVKETVDKPSREEQEKTQGEETEIPKAQEVINLVDEEDFIETKKVKVKKLEDKSTSIGGLKKKNKNKPKTQLQKPSQLIQNIDLDDDDDFDFDKKKTILIRKTYEKVNQPQRAKSTGSITQKDIDDLKARIEAKKKMLLARAMTEDTAELRNLIKKWQKGCQDALMELMELMKTKFPDRQNMDYSEMLSLLKIPSNLVGYDAENDCFNTPDDATIVLSKINDL